MEIRTPPRIGHFLTKPKKYFQTQAPLVLGEVKTSGNNSSAIHGKQRMGHIL